MNWSLPWCVTFKFVKQNVILFSDSLPNGLGQIFFHGKKYIPEKYFRKNHVKIRPDFDTFPGFSEKFNNFPT